MYGGRAPSDLSAGRRSFLWIIPANSTSTVYLRHVSWSLCSVTSFSSGTESVSGVRVRYSKRFPSTFSRHGYSHAVFLCFEQRACNRETVAGTRDRRYVFRARAVVRDHKFRCRCVARGNSSSSSGKERGRAGFTNEWKIGGSLHRRGPRTTFKANISLLDLMNIQYRVGSPAGETGPRDVD